MVVLVGAGVISSTEFGMTMINADAADLNVTTNDAQIVDGVMIRNPTNVESNASMVDYFAVANETLVGRADGHAWTNFSSGDPTVTFNVSGTNFLNLSSPVSASGESYFFLVRTLACLTQGFS